MNAAELYQPFEGAHPSDILRWAVDTYGDQLALVTSFQKTGIVTLHMLEQLGVQVPVLTLDTGNLFPETLALINTLEAWFKIEDLRRVRPGREVPVDLWRTNTELCCQMRKVIPLQKALEPFGAWVTGVRRDQSMQRAMTPIVGKDSAGRVKIAPFAAWTAAQIDEYIEKHLLPYNLLHDRGYPSIGCMPCTHPVSDEADPRAGRWKGSEKTECGIHLHKK